MEEMTIEQLDVELTQTRKTIEDIKLKRIMMGDDANEYMVEPPKDMEEPRRGQCYHLHQKENYFKNKLRLLMCEQDMKREILQKSREVEMETEETTVNVTGNPKEKDESGENPIEGPQEVMDITVSEDQSNCSDLPLNQEGLLQEHHQEYSPPFKLEEKLDEGTPHPPTPITCEATPPKTREGVDTMHLDVTQQLVQISPVVVGYFNVRSEQSDWINLRKPKEWQEKPLTVEEKLFWNFLQETSGLLDSALHMTNTMDYLPTHHRVTYQQQYSVPSGAVATYYHPFTVS
ncbi:UNVERIFIED_CONTAM: hypothetical protein K2H54_062265 [Gekko kuhli]